MHYDDIDTLERQKRREERAARLRAEQMAMLLASARTLIPDHGIAMPLSRVAVHAGVPRRAAAALVSTTADLAVALVCAALRALIETTAPCVSDTPAEYAARLVRAVHADAPAHRIHWALTCGLPGWQRAEVDATADFLAFALGSALFELRAGPGACDPAAARLAGTRLLALARAAALGPAMPDARAEGTALVAMLDAALPDAALPDAPLTVAPLTDAPMSELVIADHAFADADMPDANMAAPVPAARAADAPQRIGARLPALSPALAPVMAWPRDDDPPPHLPPYRLSAPPAHGPPPG